MIVEKIDRFVAAVAQAQRGFEREDYREKCQRAITMANDAKKKLHHGETGLSELSVLKRYVSDSLPWDDSILNTWEAVQKEIDKKCK